MCPLRRKCLGALALSKMKHTDLQAHETKKRFFFKQKVTDLTDTQNLQLFVLYTFVPSSLLLLVFKDPQIQQFPRSDDEIAN